MANYESRISLAPWLLTGDGGQQAVKIQGMRAAGLLQWPGPQLPRAVGGQLDAVAIGVGQVDGLVRAVVGGSSTREEVCCLPVPSLHPDM